MLLEEMQRHIFGWHRSFVMGGLWLGGMGRVEKEKAGRVEMDGGLYIHEEGFICLRTGRGEELRG